MVFEEKQQLKLWWLYVLLGIELILVCSILMFDKDGVSLEGLKKLHYTPIVGIALPFVVVHLATKNCLTLKIDQCGISYRYAAFSRKLKSISWTQIDQLYLRKYNAISEYGGWGLRYKLWFNWNDKAYIFNDKSVGLQLALNNSKRLLFSTAKADELSLFLINFKRQYNIGAIETDVRER